MYDSINLNSRKCKLIYIDREWLSGDGARGTDRLQKGRREQLGVMYDCYLDCGHGLTSLNVSLENSC